jgi:4-hydroxy-tetrahydrodipicolinate synthase
MFARHLIRNMSKIPLGIIAPLTTPFLETGEISCKAVQGQAGFLLDNGADALAIGGSAGEGHTLSPDELRQLVCEVKEVIPDSVPVIASAIVDSTRQAIAMSQAVADLGVDAIQKTRANRCPHR